MHCWCPNFLDKLLSECFCWTILGLSPSTGNNNHFCISTPPTFCLRAVPRHPHFACWWFAGCIWPSCDASCCSVADVAGSSGSLRPTWLQLNSVDYGDNIRWWKMLFLILVTSKEIRSPGLSGTVVTWVCAFKMVLPNHPNSGLPQHPGPTSLCSFSLTVCEAWWPCPQESLVPNLGLISHPGNSCVKFPTVTSSSLTCHVC